MTAGDITILAIAILFFSVFFFLMVILPSIILMKKRKNSEAEVKSTIKAEIVFFVALLLIFLFCLFTSTEHFNPPKSTTLDKQAREAVKSSSTFEDICYDYENNVLSVTFRESGSTYNYYYITLETWEDFVYSDSLGQYYNTFIKGKYPILRID